MSGFGSNPTTGTQGALSANQFPLSSVAEPGRAAGDLTALEGGPGSVDSNSNRTAPASVYVKDGGNVAQGTTTDAAVTGDNSGTLSAKLRGLTKILADVWDSTNHLFHQNIKQVGGAAVDTNSGNKSAGTQRIVLATDQPQLTNALKVDGSGVTQPVSGTVTANAGTGSFTVAQATGSNLHTVIDAGSAVIGHVINDASSAVIGHVIADSGSTTAVTQATASNLNAQVVGSVASGASNAGNPVKDGGVFNTTQPTVTNGQVVDAQYSARGAAIVATGVDAFAVNASQTGTWNVTNVSGTVSLPTGASTSAKQPALGTAGSASSDVITIQGIASMTALKTDGSGVTQPVSGTVSITTNSAVNVAQVGGTNSDTNSGNKSAGTLRVVLATDQPALTNKLLVTPDSVALPANQSVNVAQIAGSTTSTAATGVQKVGVVGNSGATVDSTIGAGTAPTNAVVSGSVYNSSAPAPTSGQAMALQADQAGNHRIFPGIALAALSAWNSGTSLNATQNIFTNSGAEAVLVQLTQTTTLTAGAMTFEVTYDGSTWLTIPASSVLDPTSTTFAQMSLPYTVQASTNKQFLLNMNGAQGLRIKLSTQITGSGTVTPNYALLPFSPADTVIALSSTASTGTPTSVSASASAISLLSANPSRKAFYLFNDSSATLYLGLFAHGSLTTSLYTTQVPAQTLYELPASPVYTGEVSGIWASATGNARVTEMS